MYLDTGGLTNIVYFFSFVDFLPTYGIVRSSHNVYGSYPVQPPLPVLDSYRGDLKNKLTDWSNKWGEEIKLANFCMV